MCLLNACFESVETGREEYMVSPLEVAFTVLRVVREIETNGDYDPDETDNGDSRCAQYFFNGFRSVAKTRDFDFLYNMMYKVPATIEDKLLSEDELRKAFRRHMDKGK